MSHIGYFDKVHTCAGTKSHHRHLFLPVPVKKKTQLHAHTINTKILIKLNWCDGLWFEYFQMQITLSTIMKCILETDCDYKVNKSKLEEKELTKKGASVFPQTNSSYCQTTALQKLHA